ncbi:MAG: hypothetical protein ABI399_04510 [Bauldia sp.]
MRLRSGTSIGLLAVAIFAGQGVAFAQDPQMPAQGFLDATTYAESLKAIFLLFVLAVFVESGLAVIFNWRPFVENLVPRAVRPLVAVFISLILVYVFNLDIVSGLITTVTKQTAIDSDTGKILTALIIAGGSAGINTMLISLGYRQVRTPESIVEKPPPTKAWIAVRALPGDAVGPLNVFAGPPPAEVTNGGATTVDIPLIGIIAKRSRRNLLSYFVPDRGRTPNYGGHAVTPGQSYVVLVEGKDAAGTRLIYQWGPYKIDAGSIIDIDVKV